MIQPSLLHRFFPLATLLLLLSVVGCVRSTQPILNDSQVISNNDVLGKWVSDDGKTTVEISAPKDDDKSYGAKVSSEDGGGDLFLVRLGKVDDTLIAEVRGGDMAPQASSDYKSHFLPLYSFLVVRDVTPTKIVVASMDDGWLKRYLDAHPDALQLLPGTSKDDMVVISPTDDWQTFVMKHLKDEGAMGTDATLVRPGDPTTRPAAGP